MNFRYNRAATVTRLHHRNHAGLAPRKVRSGSPGATVEYWSALSRKALRPRSSGKRGMSAFSASAQEFDQ